MTTSFERPPPITNHLSKAPKFPQSNPNRGPARVNSDKRHGPKSSDSARNEIVTRDNLPWPNCDSDGKADNKSDKHLQTLTRDVSKFRGWHGTPPPTGPPNSVSYPLIKLSINSPGVLFTLNPFEGGLNRDRGLIWEGGLILRRKDDSISSQ